MKDFLKRVQADLSKLQHTLQNDIAKLQKTVEREGNELVKKVKATAKTIAKNQNVDKRVKEFEKRAKELESFVNTKIEKLEPALNQFISGVRKNADKYGIDLSNLEKTLKTQLKKASAKAKKTTGKKASAKKTTTKSKAKAKPAAVTTSETTNA